MGRHLATESFETTPDGYWRLLEWFASHGEIITVGMEGTGSYGAELSRFLRGNGLTVIEVDRPDRKARRANGKSDPVDAYAAATAVLSGRADGTPKTRDGVVESIRVLRVARNSAVKARTQAINQIRALMISAPSEVRDRFRGLSTKDAWSPLTPEFSAPTARSAASLSECPPCAAVLSPLLAGELS
ncbi:transposase [Streptomyces sp. NBC_00647]|uniref:IS110 family transposase n=1 Tax=Streptomyces sp. NBC_00647 TaxID=2975796 RepID=UPI0038666D5B